MWSIKVLNGSQKGQFYNLKQGINRFGRLSNNNFVLESNGISKNHFEIFVDKNKLTIKDLNSSNGTFVNGLKIKSIEIRLGDKIAVHDIKLQVALASDSKNILEYKSQAPVVNQPFLAPPISAAVLSIPTQQNEMSSFDSSTSIEPQGALIDSNLKQDSKQKFSDYIENVVLPGVYRLPEVFDFKNILYGLGFVFILSLVILSVFPMQQITSESISIESKRRALSVARSLAQSNQRLFKTQDVTTYSTNIILEEDGIEDVYIVGIDGTILAPPERVGMTPKEIGFIREIKGKSKDFAKEASNGLIAASVPILTYDSESNQNMAKAHVVVIYNPGNLKFDDGRVFSLFITTFTMALALGFILFFFLSKLIDRPFILLRKRVHSYSVPNSDMNKESFKLPAYNDLVSDLDGLVATLKAQTDNPQSNSQGLKENDFLNLIQMVGYPAILMSASGQVIQTNSAFEQLFLITPQSWNFKKVEDLPDQALQKNLQNLMTQSAAAIGEVFSDQLDVGGNLLSIKCQSWGQSEVSFYLFIFGPLADQYGGAA